MKAITALTIFGLLALAYAAVPAVPAEAPTTVPPTVPSSPPPAPTPTAPAPPKCPPESHNVTLLPNPADCCTYYACDRGVPVLMHCPADLHFNDREKACDWPERACCDPAFDYEKKCKKPA